ncbi:MAG TPA: molybdopterin-binding protein [Geobacteraceae bacterium]
MKAAILTMSDKGAEGLREDASGPALEKWLAGKGVSTLQYGMIPDDLSTIAAPLSLMVSIAAFIPFPSGTRHSFPPPCGEGRFRRWLWSGRSLCTCRRW